MATETKASIADMLEDENPFLWLVGLALHLGHRDIHKRDKPLVIKIDEQWTVTFNGTTEEVNGIPPLGLFLTFNDWPAGILTYTEGGEIAAGQAANVDTLKAAILERMKGVPA